MRCPYPRQFEKQSTGSIAIRRADHAFQERLKKCLDEDREVLELLAE